MNIHAVRRYVSPRTRALTPEEQETRWISYALKDWTGPDFSLALQTAAPEMAALIEGPCTLIPIPSSKGSTQANRRLANQIAKRIEGACPQPGRRARVVDCLRRTAPVPSSCERHKTRQGGLPVDAHNFQRDPRQWLDAVPVYFFVKLNPGREPNVEYLTNALNSRGIFLSPRQTKRAFDSHKAAVVILRKFRLTVTPTQVELF